MSEHIRTGQTTLQLGFTSLAKAGPGHLGNPSGHGETGSKFDPSDPFWSLRSIRQVTFTLLHFFVSMNVKLLLHAGSVLDGRSDKVDIIKWSIIYYVEYVK